MTEIDRAEKKAMKTLNDWVDAMMPKFEPIELAALRQRLTAAFREYETELAEARQYASAIEEGSAEWEESFNQAKALEKAAIEKWQRYKSERDILRAALEKYADPLQMNRAKWMFISDEDWLKSFGELARETLAGLKK